MHKKPRTKPVPVRLDDDLRQRLARAAHRMGSNASAVIRFSVIQQLPDIERGNITLSPDAPFPLEQ